MVSLPTPRYACTSFNVYHFSMFLLLNYIDLPTFWTIYSLPLQLLSATGCNPGSKPFLHHYNNPRADNNILIATSIKFHRNGGSSIGRCLRYIDTVVHNNLKLIGQSSWKGWYVYFFIRRNYETIHHSPKGFFFSFLQDTLQDHSCLLDSKKSLCGFGRVSCLCYRAWIIINFSSILSLIFHLLNLLIHSEYRIIEKIVG